MLKVLEQTISNEYMTTNNNNRVPELRFPGFTGEWEEKKLGEIGTVIQGYGFPDKYQGQKKGDLPFCKVGDISAAVDRGKITINSAANYVNYSLLPTLHAQPIPVGSTIFAKIGEAIRSNKRLLTGVPCLIDNNAAAIKAKDTTCDNFMFYIMSQVNLANYSGGIVPSVNKSTIESINILLPPTLAEQQKIAECLSSLDEEIAAEAQKADALKDHKKGLMQQLFPAISNEQLAMSNCVPKLRFPGFEGEWEEKKLGEVCHINRGVRVTRNDLNNNWPYPVFQNTDSPLGFYDKFNVKANNPFVIIGGSAGLVGFSKTNFWAADDCAYFGDCDNVNSYFLYMTLLFHSLEIKNFIRGGNIPRIDRKSLEQLRVSIPPTLAEQQKIADCLSELDEMISAQQQKVEALKEHKKGLMQKLFPKMSNTK